MTRMPELEPGPPRLTLLVDPDRHRALVAICDFLAAIHHTIDPEMFDIDDAHVEWLRGVVDVLDPGWITITITRDELFALETMTNAAWEYSARSTTGVSLDTTESELRDLEAWIMETYRQFRSTVH